MKIENHRQKRAKQMIDSILADKGTKLKPFCESKGLNYNETYQKLFRNKQVELSELNDFIKLIDANLSLEITEKTIVWKRRQLKN
jgi:hypothetical protein